MPVPTLPGITPKTITTSRLTTRVLFSGPEDGAPVLFLHGNTSSATWWEETMLALPEGFRGIAPDQRGFGDADPQKKVDATQGMGDMAADAAALLETLGIQQAHIVGHSLGGSVVWRFLAAYPERILTVTQVSPGSPFGFGGTKDLDGAPCTPDYSGTGGGLVNPELVKRMGEGDRSTESPFSPRNAIRALIFKPPFIAPREEDLLTSMLTEHLGPQDQPGDSTPSPNWPFVAPGVWGAANGLSPKYALDVKKLFALQPKPKVLWVRGTHDMIVSDAAASDIGNLGKLGVIPGWPGMEIYPPAPMVSQTRAVLEKYAAAGGWFKEVVIENTGHTPYIENPDAFNQAFHDHLYGS